jgi:hypothetical protein
MTATTSAAATIYRVFHFEESLREDLRTARETKGQTTAVFIRAAVDEQLPALVASLQALGFGRPATKVRPARLPFAEETLQTLRTASHEVAVPANHLLALVLASAALAANTKPSKRGRRKAAEPTEPAKRKRAAK